MSPASSISTSPGTRSAEAICVTAPSLKTLAFGAESFLSESSDLQALTYCIVPSNAFRIITAKITIVLSTLPEIMEITAATIRIITSRSANWLKKTIIMLFSFCPVSSFFPYCSVFSDTRADVRPRSSPYSRRTSSLLIRYASFIAILLSEYNKKETICAHQKNAHKKSRLTTVSFSGNRLLLEERTDDSRNMRVNACNYSLFVY